MHVFWGWGNLRLIWGGEFTLSGLHATLVSVMTSKKEHRQIIPRPLSVSGREIRLLLNAEGYEFSGFNGEGIGFRVIVDAGASNDLFLPAASPDYPTPGAGVLVATGRHASINIRRTDVSPRSSLAPRTINKANGYSWT